MAYIGQKPFQEFSSIPTKDSFTGDGSTTTFDLANDVVRGAEFALEVFIDNVRQEPGSGKAFTLGIDGSNNYRRITFTAAPANGASIYVINDKTNLTTIAPVQTDFNGVEIVLDADSDTTLHAETDDQVDLRIAGNDVLKFLQSSGDAVLKPMVDAKDIIFQQFDGNKIFEINDGNFVGVGGNATAPGEIRIYEDSDNGSNYSGFKAAASTTSSVAYQLPAADGSSGESLTTNGSGVLSWSAGVTIANDTNNRIVTADGSSGLNGEANLTFDGTTLALTGNSTVSGTLGVSGVTTSNAGVVVDNITIDGTEIDLSSGDLTIDVAGDIVLDADGADVLLKDDGTTYGVLTNGSGNLIIKSNTTTAATFTNANVAFAGTLSATALTGSGVLSTSDSTEATSTTSASLKTAGGLGVVKDIVAGDDIKLLSDSSVIHFGADSDITLTHNADTGLTLNGILVANELDISGNIDVDGTTNLDVVDIDGAVDMASTLQVDGSITSSSAATITTNDNTATLTLKSTDEDANTGPTLQLVRDSASPADNDLIGSIGFIADDDAGNTFTAFDMFAKATDVSNGNEDGEMQLRVMVDGTVTDRIKLNADGTTFTGGINVGNTITAGSTNLTLDVSGDIILDADGDNVTLKAAGTTVLDFVLGGSSDVTLDAPGRITISADDNGEIKFADGASVYGQFKDDSDRLRIESLIQDADIMFVGNDGGSEVTALTLDMSAAGFATFTDKVKADAFFVGQTAANGGEVFGATVDGTSNIARFIGSNDGATAQIGIANTFSANGSTDETATLRYTVGNGGAVIQAYKVSDTQTGGARDVGLQFKTQTSNSEQLRFQIDDAGNLTATDTSIGSLSDERLKKDIADLTYSIDTFKALKPRTFNWKNAAFHNNETNRRGFVAQELITADSYWVHEQKATKKSDDILEPATYYEATTYYEVGDTIPDGKSVGDVKKEGDTIPDGKSVGDVKTEATYTYKYEAGDGSDFDLLNDGSDLDGKELIAKLGKKDAMYVSVIQQLIARIEALEDA